MTQLLEDLDEEYDILISSITLAKHNILHPKVISPKDLLNELSNVKLVNGLHFPLSISYSTIHKYFEISKLQVLLSGTILIFGISIPLVEELNYNLFKLLPLPVSHSSSNLYSYIEPTIPYLLISTSKVYYVAMRDLSTCTKTTEDEYICKNSQAIRVQEHPVCEVFLYVSIIKKIPEDCLAKTVKANFEIWHPLEKNTWLFLMSNPTPLTLSCQDSQIEDIEIKSSGLLSIEPFCKGYTQTITLQAFSVTTRNVSYYTPDYNIVLDDCCLKKEIKLNITPLDLEPVKITNLKLDELNFANHKLNQLDDLLDIQLKKPFIVQHVQPWNF
ncbi:uncharacterized protein LOC115890598 isoform X2 [Sitophilus oryzae]|uniref:Uncharacterized protein LOC115879974 isoform X2 n=1 Tax=Sitophilus oryzae TaxID=7048 RepID=A0A6J2YRN6_SITOR|nr:uncharacterized protein LOC115879974 isoform X2 [Sitophilus oryzae]XP_030766738.1 uncharacterized protein LOC115890598 isoform X2 [Sitophilus oryzae]